MNIVKRYKETLNLIDGWLYSLTVSEHGVLLGVLAALSYFLSYHSNLIVLLVKAIGMAGFAPALYIGYRLWSRLEPRDDFE
jgi:hypothetical protein